MLRAMLGWESLKISEETQRLLKSFNNGMAKISLMNTTEGTYKTFLQFVIFIAIELNVYFC